MNPKPYRVYSHFLKQQFGHRVHKISVDAGFTCPNRGETRSGSGCLFCDPNGSGATGIARRLSIQDQLEHGKEIMRRKYKAKEFIAYFQPFSNTYAPVETLRRYYDEALKVDGIVGLAIGTRPDCVAPEVLELLAEYNQRTDLWLELGLQSCHDSSLEFLRRGHDYAAFLEAAAGAQERGIRLCVHVILGLPGENHAQMLETADEMARLHIDGVKIHLLHILAGTALGEMYTDGNIDVLDQDEYVSLAVDFIERLHPHTLIHRLTGDGPRDTLLAPLWSLNKWEVLNAIDATFAQRGSRQGSRCRYA
ncbi:MAG: TIGR01212 family radical SAM protein [Geobacteraceae bacterium]|nr:TIGR01212 family radical SAM protein [Geobacteraceae bacterium]